MEPNSVAAEEIEALWDWFSATVVLASTGMLNPASFAFAKQVRSTHVIVQLVDYFKKGGAANPPTGSARRRASGLGPRGGCRPFVDFDELRDIKKQIEEAGLVW
jgi:hypothetical protein